MPTPTKHAPWAWQCQHSEDQDLLHTHQSVTVRSKAVDGQDLAPGPASSKQERKMPIVLSLLFYKCA